jgi:membrane-bound lytic murein transglycosylase B
VTDRVQLAFDRVLNDEPTKNAFNKFFSALGFSDIVAGMLDPINQIPALERKVKAAEIGGAALRQGLTASELAMAEEQASVPFSNVTRGTLGADVLAQQGVTKAQAEAGFRKIAEVLPTAEKLSSIYGGTEAQYGRLEAEQEQLQGLASAARKRQRLSELETAQFKKSSGLGKRALGSITNI